MRSIWLPFCFVSVLCVAAFGQERLGSPLAHTHAHNDYEHAQPLWDALEQGFSSVEADIYLVDGKLLVGHDRVDLKPERTLQNLYLDPLRALTVKNHGTVYPNGARVTLLIDIKSEAGPTYAALKPVLEEYATMLTRFKNGRIATNAITVILSGNRPRSALLAENDRLAAYDGRLEDLGHDLPLSFMPLVSESYAGKFPAKTDRAALLEAIRKTHAEGRAIRFWATNDDPVTWQMLRDAGVDWLNADDLHGLAEFLRK